MTSVPLFLRKRAIHHEPQDYQLPWNQCPPCPPSSSCFWETQWPASLPTPSLLGPGSPGISSFQLSCCPWAGFCPFIQKPCRSSSIPRAFPQPCGSPSLLLTCSLCEHGGHLNFNSQSLQVCLRGHLCWNYLGRGACFEIKIQGYLPEGMSGFWISVNPWWCLAPQRKTFSALLPPKTSSKIFHNNHPLQVTSIPVPPFWVSSVIFLHPNYHVETHLLGFLQLPLLLIPVFLCSSSPSLAPPPPLLPGAWGPHSPSLLPLVLYRLFPEVLSPPHHQEQDPLFPTARLTVSPISFLLLKFDRSRGWTIHSLVCFKTLSNAYGLPQKLRWSASRNLS